MIRKLLSILLCVSMAFTAVADFRAGLDAYRRGDYATARRELLQAARAGDPDAQSKVGVLYANGLGGARDFAKAVKWFRKAARQGLAKGEYNLGVVYAEGRMVPRDYREAVKWYRRAAEQGFVEAQYSLGGMYHKGQGIAQSYVQAFAWLSVAAASGYEPAIDMREVVRSKLTSLQLERGRTAARALYRKYPPKKETPP